MRRAAKVDGNHSVIVATLRAVGATVQSLAAVGRGVPDLLVGFRGRNYLLEVKDGTKPPSRRRLTDDERTWHSDWRGTVRIVMSPDDALAAVGVDPIRTIGPDL